MATSTKPRKAVAANGHLSHDQLVTRVKRSRRDGQTLQQIADELGVSVNTVRRLDGYVPPGKASAKASTNGKPATNGAAKPAKATAKPAAAKASAKTPPKAKPAKAAAKTPDLKEKPAKAIKDLGVGVVDIAVVKAAELHRWLSDVQPFRGYDDTLPMLTGTHVEWDGARLLAATTDRFTLGVSKLDMDPMGLQNGSFMLAPDDVGSLLRIAKTARKDVDWRQVTISRVGEIPAGCTVPTFTFQFKFFSGEQLTIKPFDVEFPKFKQLLPSGEPIARALTCVNPDYLAKFAKVANASRQIRFYSFDDNETGGARPTAVLIGENFVGLIMPVRVPEGTHWAKPSWVA